MPAAIMGSRRARSVLVCDSRRMTSAPRCASCIAQNGPAHTQLKSATRTPSSGSGCGTRGPGTTGGLTSVDRAASTSSWCSPSRGAGRRIAHHGAARRYGGPGWRRRPAHGCSTSTKNACARSCSSSARSAIVHTGAKQTRRSCPARNRSRTFHCCVHSET